MDCLYNAYVRHVDQLGLKTGDTRAIFYAMRSSVLQDSTYGGYPSRANVVGGRRRRKKKKKKNHRPNSQIAAAAKGNTILMNTPGGAVPVEVVKDTTPILTEAEIQEILEEEYLINSLATINDQGDSFDPTDAFASSDENGLINGRPWYEQNDEFWEENGFLLEDETGLLLPNPNPGAVLTSVEEVIDNVNKTRNDAQNKHKPEWMKKAEKKGEPWWKPKLPSWNSPHMGLRMAYTPTAVAPWIINTLARLDGLEVKMQQWSWYNAEALYQEAETDFERQIILTSDYGKEVEHITLEPAIYCVTSSKHAQFGTTVPKHGVIALAIQLSLSPDRVPETH